MSWDDVTFYVGLFFGVLLSGPLCWAIGWGRGFRAAQRIYQEAGHE
jgi:hypothetical protein